MIDEARRIMDSLDRCNRSECKKCKIGLGFGCASELRRQAANMLNRLLKEIETPRDGEKRQR